MALTHRHDSARSNRRRKSRRQGVRRVVAGIAVTACAAIGLFVTDEPASAVSCPAADTTHFTVTNNADSAGAPPTGSLRAALSAAMMASNPAICIEASVSTITLDPVAGPLNYSGLSPVSIVGNGTMILGNNTFTLLQVGTTVPLTVDGLTMTGGLSAIEAFDVMISNSTFSNNTGGAVRGASVALVHDLFEHNDAFEHNMGSAVQAGSAVTVAGSTFTDNSRRALSAHESVTVTGSTFSGNRDGAIVGDTTVQIMDSALTDNSADEGGGVFARGGVTVSSSTFARNAANIGGAIFNEGDDIVIANSTFTDNSSNTGGGGAVAGQVCIGGVVTPCTPGTVTAVYSTFSGNTAADGGSALRAGAGGTVFGTVFVKPTGATALCTPSPGTGAQVFASAGYNYANETTNSCALTATGDSSADANDAEIVSARGRGRADADDAAWRSPRRQDPPRELRSRR